MVLSGESGDKSQQMLNLLSFMRERIIIFWTIFGGILVVKVKNGGNNGGNMMYDYGLDHGDQGGQFFVLTTGYSDFDWAGNPADIKSTSGYAFHIGSGVVSWSSKKQPIVSFLSIEA